MDLARLSQWLRAVAASTGGTGLFLISFLDSSVLSFPLINDLLVVELSIRNPSRMPFYASMTTLGSVAGCLFLYALAYKGGEVFFRKRAGERAEHIRAWTQRNGFLSVLVPALLPPPTPFKAFVIAAGVFQVRLRTFLLALLLARGFRYFGIGFLAARYGSEASRYLTENKLEFSLIVLGAVLGSYLLYRFVWRAHRPQ